MGLTERTWTTIRWTACGVLVIGVVALIVGFNGHDDRASSAPVDASTRTTPAGDTATPDPPETAGTSPAPQHTPTGARTSASGSGGPPNLPAEAQGLTLASAEAFARYYFDQASNYLKRTGDPSAIRGWSEPSCGSCRHRITYFAFANGRNKRLTGDYLWRNTEVRQVQLNGTRSAVVEIESSTGANAAVERAGAAPVRYPGGLNTFTMTLVARSGNWAVLDLEFA
jgi:hypothetical protein